MQDLWEISGEIGAAMGPGLLPLQALFPLVRPLVFRSQAADSWGYFLPIEADGSNSAYVPDRMQVITLWRNGQREFTGRVVTRKYIWNPTGQGWQIEVKGGWYELERLPLLAASSATYDIPQQNLSTSIRDIITLAISQGARIQLGNVAEMMDCFPLQFRASSVAATLSDLLRFAQDAMCYVDYTTPGMPTIHVTRRPTAAVREIILGRDAIIQCELSPDDSVATDRVDFTYAVADTNGIVTQQTQSAGADAPRNRLTVVTAGTGFEDFQARATQTQQTVRTVMLSGSLPLSVFIARDARLGELEAAYPGLVSANLSSGPLSVSSPTWSGFTITNWTFPQSRRVLGSAASPTFTHYLVNGAWQEWMASKIGIASEEVQVEGTYWVAANKSFGFTAGQVELLQAMELFYENPGFWFYRYKSTVTTRALSVAYATDTILRDPGDFPLMPPPSGIASFLLSTMAEAPYEGRIVGDAYLGYARTLGKVVNVVGGTPELAACRATTREESYDLPTGTWTLQTGQSSAGSGLDLLSRFRRLSAT
jgi:hypothetical protein